MPEGYPVAGSLQPVAYQYLKTSSEDAPIMDLLVTTPIRRNIVLGFRFFPRSEGYLSQCSSTVTFTLRRALRPGSYLRLTDGGKTLVSYSSDPDSPKVVGNATTPPLIRDFSSCFVFWAPCLNKVEGISFIGLKVPVAYLRSTCHCYADDDLSCDEYLYPLPPPTCVLPCQFAIVVTINTVAAPEVRYVVYNGTKRGVPAKWIRAWQILKFGGRTNWAQVSQVSYDDFLDSLRATLFLALEAGQLFPIAYRPHTLECPDFPAQLSLVVTEEIPSKAVVWIVPNCSDVNNVRAEALWKWSAPKCETVCAGTVLDLSGLAYKHKPRASVGCIERTGSWPDCDFPITSFTLYAYSENASPDETIYPVTALYTCSYDCEIPFGLIPGQSMPKLPWPDCASILPVETCSVRPIRDWGCHRLLLASLCPIRWFCQPLPVFRVASLCPEPLNCCCIDSPSTIGVMSGSCNGCF